MKKSIAVALAAASIVVLVEVEAMAKKAPVYFKSMQFAGTGCKLDSGTVTGKHTSTIAIRFDKYNAANPSSAATSDMQRTACSFTVPIHVPSGFRVSSMNATWQVYAKGSTELIRESFTAGQRGKERKTRSTGNYTRHDSLTDTLWSGCAGGTMPLRVNSSVRAIGKHSYIKMKKLLLHLHWKKCQ